MCHVVREIIHFWNANTFLERQYIFGTPVWNWLHEMCHVIRAMRRDCNCQLVNRQICLHTFWLTRETKLLHAKCAIDYTKCVMWSVWNWHEMCDVELMNWHEMCELTRNVWIDTKCVNWHEMCDVELMNWHEMCRLTRNVWIDTKCVNCHEMCELTRNVWCGIDELTRNVWIDTKCVNWHEMCELTRNVWIDTKCVNWHEMCQFFILRSHTHIHSHTHNVWQTPLTYTRMCMCDRLHSHTHVYVCVYGHTMCHVTSMCHFTSSWSDTSIHTVEWRGLRIGGGNLLPQKGVFCIFRFQSIWMGISEIIWVPEYFGEITRWHKLINLRKTHA